jgi:flagellin
MRINTNVSALNAFTNLGRTESAVSQSMNRLSSGFRINRAADDAAGLAIANKLQTEGRSLSQASRNIEQATAVFQIAEGAGTSIGDILQRMKELATQAASDTNDSQRTSLDSEFTTLINEIDRISTATKFQSTALLDGSFSSKTLQIGATNATDNQLTISLGNLGTGSSGLDITGLRLTSLASAQAAMASVDAAVTTVNTKLADIGAYQNRLDYAATNVKTAVVNLSAAESTIRDVDMAQEMTSFSKNQILQQAGTAMLAQANQLGQGVLQLLRG